ncbi:MAG TPA: ABC transporter permease [Syntrophomonadaceae bacterium]|nr:ABC transporter permease [Syntrophomonadaceae bacterium]
MDLRFQNNPSFLGQLFIGTFWLVFALTSLFFIGVIAGLISYSDLATIRNVLGQAEFRYAIKFTLLTSITATIFAVIVALPCGYILSRYDMPGKVILDTLVDIPIILPPLVSGIALLIFFGPVFGDSLAKIGVNVVFSKLGVVVAQWFVATPYAIRTFQQAFNSIDPRMEKVAKTLGYSPTQVFLKVTIPLAKMALIGGVMMSWARALGEFGATAMLAGITRMKTETLSVAIFLNMSIGDMDFAIATAVVMLCLALLLLVFVKTLIKNGVRL